MGRLPVLKALPYGNYSLVSLPQEAGSLSEAKCLAADAPSNGYEPSNALSIRSKSISGNKTPENVYQDDDQQGWIAAEALDWLCIPRSLSSKLNPRKRRHVGRALATEEGFFDAHRHFMLGHSFLESYRRTVLLVFDQSPDILADAYHVVLDLMPRRQHGVLEYGDFDIKLGAKCLGGLVRMSSSIKCVEDAATIVMLGQILLVYNTLIPCPSTRTITRGTLLAVRDWYPVLIQEPDLDSITLAPVVVDTLECLLRREIPVVRFPSTDRHIVDRFLGVTASLLPPLYDLCERSNYLRESTLDDSPETKNSHDSNPYADIEIAISAWMPLTPPDFYSKYTIPDINVMLVQAYLYRLTALLIIHRLRFPLGLEDSIGHSYAKEIFRELYSLKDWPTTGATGLGLDFPLFVAMVELPKVGLEAFRAFDALRYRKQHPTDIMNFIKLIEDKRKAGFNGSWLDLVGDGFHGDILP